MEMEAYPNDRPVYRLSGAERAQLQAAFAQHIQTAAPFVGVHTSAAGDATAFSDTTRRPSRFMPLDRTPAGGYHALPVHSKKSTWAMIRDAWQNATQHKAGNGRK